MTSPQPIHNDALEVYNAACVRWLEAFALAAISTMAEMNEQEKLKRQKEIEVSTIDWALKFWEVDRQEADEAMRRIVGMAIMEIFVGKPIHGMLKQISEDITRKGWTPTALMQLGMVNTPGS